MVSSQGNHQSRRRVIALSVVAGCSLAGIATVYYLKRRRGRQQLPSDHQGDDGAKEKQQQQQEVGGKMMGGCCSPPKLRTLHRRPTEELYTSCLQNLDGNAVKPLINGIQESIIDATPSAPPLTVAVAGGTGSGKTTFAQAIYRALGEEHVTYITHDSYYKDLSHLPVHERAKQNFDHPASLDTALLVKHMEGLRRGESVHIPVYDFATHTRKAKETTLAVPRQVILLEGILIFAEPALVKLLDIKVFVDTEADIRLIRRLHRDVKERGRTFDSVISQYVKTVRPMHQEFVEPSKRFADVIIPTGINQVVLDMFLSRLQHEIGGGPPSSRPLSRSSSGGQLATSLPTSLDTTTAALQAVLEG